MWKLFRTRFNPMQCDSARVKMQAEFSCIIGVLAESGFGDEKIESCKSKGKLFPDIAFITNR